MKRQMKIAAVVSATALLAIGASFTSMAAAKTYDWRLDENGESVCYNADGELYTETWVESNGYKFYVDEDGHYLRNTWVEGEGDDLYYVKNDGSMVTNDWREVVAIDGDEDEDASWFYFGNNGKMVTTKKISWKDNTYYVGDDGKMLTGWVEYKKIDKENTVCKEADGDTLLERLVYCGESGEHLNTTWVKDFAPSVTDEEAEDMDESDMNYYYIKANGKLQTGRNKDIAGNTYFFDSEDGHMLTGWVKKVDTNKYEEFSGDLTGNNKNIYFCGAADEGWVKKDRWVSTYIPEKYVEAMDAVANGDADLYEEDLNWYWINKEGYVFIPNNATSANTVTLKNGSAEDMKDVFSSSDATRAQEFEINKKTYLFDEDGTMMTGFVKLGENQDMFYYGDDGARKTGKQTVTDESDDAYEMFFATKATKTEKLGAAITGTEGKKLYINGLLQTAESNDLYKVVKVNEKEYIVDENGKVQSSTRTAYEFENKNGKWNATFTGTGRTQNYVKAWKAK